MSTTRFSPVLRQPARHIWAITWALSVPRLRRRLIPVEAYLFLADYHALIKNQNPEDVAQSVEKSPPPGWR